ncbi:hypothetical protein QMK19_33400 [Streptomyces sp. H10-C2]|uniref:hypothetical protein n=1 Tax=unclassified Streptomyces TaxID=2593676 RepID=UPI0024B89BDD|nr:MULTISPECIES: hypothetical protein [unclassified Streptomyces]MDJ0346455.1 hypothetical protein [Streptomyces sp. PH10-H1]MDJ0374394.1 hypothetical protein [Streptomyces sp. H10-C2]
MWAVVCPLTSVGRVEVGDEFAVGQLQAREAEVGTRAETLRIDIAALTAQLSAAEEELDRLRVAREIFLQLLADDDMTLDEFVIMPSAQTAAAVATSGSRRWALAVPVGPCAVLQGRRQRERATGASSKIFAISCRPGPG